MTFGGGSVVCIELDIESNKCLGNSKCNLKLNGVDLGGPEVIQDSVQSNIEKILGDGENVEELLESVGEETFFFRVRL